MSTTTAQVVTGMAAVEMAEQDGRALHKYADPTEGARVVTVEEARDIAAQDASLIWCADDEATLADESAPREARIAAAARLCRAADEEQVADGDVTTESELTWQGSAEQAGTIDTMRQACGGEKPSREDWQTFGRHY